MATSPPAPIQAGVVQTNHVDTVVVAEPGSRVDVHNASRDPSRYAPDTARKAAMIAAPIVFGVGGAVSGISYLTARAERSCSYPGTCARDAGTMSLVAYDSIVTFAPSMPRWAVGDVSGALVYTGLRGASVLVGTLVNWGDSSDAWMAPFLLGFLAPLTLGIVDMATTPHREDLRSSEAAQTESASLGPHLLSIAPGAIGGADHRVHGAKIELVASF